MPKAYKRKYGTEGGIINQIYIRKMVDWKSKKSTNVVNSIKNFRLFIY